jgi:hypothetical protein
MRNRLLLAAILSLLPGCGEDRTPSRPAKDVLCPIASVASKDRVSIAYALRVLAYHHIRADAGGSFWVALRVDCEHAEEAIALLKSTSALRPFLSFGESFRPVPMVWDNELVMDVELDDAMRRYDQTSTVGKILRECAPDAAALFPECSSVEAVKWRMRDFVHMDMTPAVAIEAVVGVRCPRGSSQRSYVETLEVSVIPRD